MQDADRQASRYRASAPRIDPVSAVGSGDVLLMHLGMSGSFRVITDEDTKTPGKFHHPRSGDRAHDHVVFHMSSGAAVVFNPGDTLEVRLIVPALGAPGADIDLEALPSAGSAENIKRLQSGTEGRIGAK